MHTQKINLAIILSGHENRVACPYYYIESISRMLLACGSVSALTSSKSGGSLTIFKLFNQNKPELASSLVPCSYRNCQLAAGMKTKVTLYTAAAVLSRHKVLRCVQCVHCFGSVTIKLKTRECSTLCVSSVAIWILHRLKVVL